MSAKPATPITRDEMTDAFLANLDFRISDADTTMPPASKENLMKLRPAIHLLAVNNPVACGNFVRKWMKDNL